MKGYIDNYNFAELECQRYYAPPKSWSTEKIKDITTSRIFSNEWLGSRKVDGALYVFLKDEDGNCTLRGRSKSKSGDYLDKFDWVPHLHPFFNELPNGTCLLGELYMPGNEQAKTTTSIMNCLQPKAVARQEKDKLHYYIFDILADKGKSIIETPAMYRFNLLNSYWCSYGEGYYEWAQYYSGKELWNLLQDLLANGYEGVVITRGGAPYQPGKRPSKDCLKVKKQLQETIDCVIMGANAPSKLYTGKEPEAWEYWYNEITGEKITYEEYISQYHITPYAAYVEGVPIVPVTKNWFNGWAGSLELGLYDNGALVHVGDLSGVTDEVKSNWKDYVGAVAEIGAMEIHDTGGLRHPKLIRWREDKAATDCTIEQMR